MLLIWVHTFFHDDKVRAALLVVVIDFVFGVIAAVKVGNFRFSYVADFLRNDILFKLVPYFAIYVGAMVAGNVNIIIPGFDMGIVAGSMYALVMAAWVASIVSSLATLGIKAAGVQTLATALTGKENSAPPRD